MTYTPDVTSLKLGNADADEDEKHSRGLLLSVIIHDGQQLYHSCPHYLFNVHSQPKGVREEGSTDLAMLPKLLC
jgi:hypothetical protein